MSAAPRHPDRAGYSGLRMTAEEYLSLGQTDERYELIDGVVVMSPGPTDEHSEILLLISAQLTMFALRTQAIRVFSEVDTRFSSGAVYQPDILAYRAERLDGRTKRRDLAPDLAVEILSPGNRDRDLVVKRRDYERYGVAEYWIVDPEAGQIRALRRQGPGQPFVETLVTGDSLASSAIPGFVLDLRPILDAIERSRGDHG